MYTLFTAVFLLVGVSFTGVLAADYGLDCSFPIQNKELSCGDLLGDRISVHEEYLQGCREKWGEKGAQRCDANERDRLQMSRRQPQSMVNFTETGFLKIKAPEPLWSIIKDYWETNRVDMKVENWGVGNIYTNNWKAPTYMVSVEESSLRGGGMRMKNQIWNAAKSTIEQWTNRKQKPCSLYGIRVYTEGAILAPHVDRLPLVSSAIINVDQDVEEPWVLEVYDRQDRAVNVTMEPGDMVLYESGSLVHGRPFPLKGKFFANIFIHFEPTGQHNSPDDVWDEVEDDFYPPYIVSGSPEEKNWALRNPTGWKKPSPSAAVVLHQGHAAAANGDVETLERLAQEDKRLLHAKDENGWQPIHEAVRGGQLQALEMLVKNGADINALTHHGNGVSPYYIALTSLTEDHPVAQYLSELGAINVAPDEL